MSRLLNGLNGQKTENETLTDMLEVWEQRPEPGKEFINRLVELPLINVIPDWD